MAQQTAVQWLIDVYNTQGRIFSSQFEQALQMEKEQSESICVNVIENILNELEKGKGTNSKEIFEQYYNQTFKPE